MEDRPARSVAARGALVIAAERQSAVDVTPRSRCFCPCHHGRNPLLTDRVETAFGCDGCRPIHHEAEARVSTEDFGLPAPAAESRRFRDAWRCGR